MELRQLKISERDLAMVRDLFTSYPGTEVLELLSNLFENPLSYTPGDVHQTVFYEGQRNVIKLIKTIIKLGGSNEEKSVEPEEIIIGQR